MSSLLPKNATDLELAVEQSLTMPVDVDMVRKVWNPDTCPAHLLRYLAWAWAVDEWQDDWTEGRKRAAIKESFELHRIKGTVASVKRILRLHGFAAAKLQEGDSAIKYNGAAKFDGLHTYGDVTGWAKYYLFVNDRPISTAEADSLRRALQTVAPVRCQLTEINFVASPLKYNAAAKFDGSYKFGVT